MMYIWIKNPKDNPNIIFEIEKYLDDKDRPPYAAIYVHSLNKKDILSNEERLDRIGFYILNNLLSPRSICDRYGRQWAEIIYPARPIRDEVCFNLDKEPMVKRPNRLFCHSLEIDSINMDDFLHNKVITKKIASIVLDYLPLDLYDV